MGGGPTQDRVHATILYTEVITRPENLQLSPPTIGPRARPVMFRGRDDSGVRVIAEKPIRAGDIRWEKPIGEIKQFIR